MTREDIVTASLEEFLQKHNPDISVTAIDEIVLSYMVSVLEDLDDFGSSEENLDVDEFTEMMEAYLPGFAGIKSEDVCEWMFELAAKLADVKEVDCTATVYPTPKQTVNAFPLEPLLDSKQHEKKENTDLPNTQENEQAAASSNTNPQVQLLLEMFPASCAIEVKHCLRVSKGDPELAAQLVLDRQETGECLKEKVKTSRVRNTSLSDLDDGKVTRKDIVDRYAYVDEDEDTRGHKPVIKTNDQKKMVRYRQGQVVSTKGERFSEVKKEMTDDMKKTYINLKPAKQYRFH